MAERIDSVFALRRGFAIFTAGLVVLIAALGFFAWDRDRVLQSQCEAINDVKASIVQIAKAERDTSLKQLHQLEARSPGPIFEGISNAQLRRNIEVEYRRTVRGLQPRPNEQFAHRQQSPGIEQRGERRGHLNHAGQRTGRHRH